MYESIRQFFLGFSSLFQVTLLTIIFIPVHLRWYIVPRIWSCIEFHIFLLLQSYMSFHKLCLGQLNIAVHSLFDSLLHILWYTVLGLQRYTALHKHQYTVVHKRFRIEFHISERKERISFKTCYLGTEPKKVEVVLRTRFS